ncbi:hypothetical protein UFOVP1666_52 [uncultured Caudovirales phage]|uniref:Uncharacterized protein n=1 Tax=uncultured Caudovirales phage TaxID=2100421 RepID=A0A6J5P8A2_9CAUD|nr:hypothetical protein UFOVP867_7 [uncultured Caudovirales phage]CAB4171114.1 hypothetical protein UFOVP913_191 [uncultured Caudovirales phage]CAB4176671.1 hypothetical protein UFOVP993_47 [uncultured Caudovirales phage]CAB4223009.1 hypothetical protein UFOVP1666_52 [uncultured Caudovirales phage]
MAATSNLYIDAGSTFSAIISVSGSSGLPLNLTGYTIASQIRKSYGSLTAYAFVATIYDAHTGKVRLVLPATTSSGIKPGRYLYDIEVTTPLSEKLRVVEGLVIITPEITKI